MSAESVYTEYAPPPALAPWVAAFWSVVSPAYGARTRRILPDGCADVLVSLDPAGSREPVPTVVGAMRAAVVVPPRDAATTVGVRFRPGAAAAFLGVPLHELTDRRVPLAAVSPRLSVADRLAEPGEPATLVARLARALAARLGDAPPPDAVVARAVALLRAGDGQLRVRAVADRLGVGERRLERLFDREVGVSPKLLARVFRLERARALLDRHPGRSGGWLAAAGGYADQAHLIHDFRELAGITPAAYLREHPRQATLAR